MDGIVLVTVCDPLNGCTRWSLCSSRFYLEYLLDVSMTWCLWRVTGHSVARDTRDVSRITTDHHTRVRCISLMLLRFLWCCFHLFSPCMLLFFKLFLLMLCYHCMGFDFFFLTQSFCAILVSVLFFFGWSGSFFLSTIGSVAVYKDIIATLKLQTMYHFVTNIIHTGIGANCLLELVVRTTSVLSCILCDGKNAA